LEAKAMDEQRPTNERQAIARLPTETPWTAVITGANSGVGFETAKALAGGGARVVLACRDVSRANEAAARIRTVVPGAALQVVRLDLASLGSVREAADKLRAELDHIDVLVNNAGLMRAPYSRSADGFELHLGTNHLGHYAFTGLVLDRLRSKPGSRVITITSPAHRQGRVDFDDLQSERGYRPAAAYAQSKLANLLFAYGLQRRLSTAGAKTISLAAHPGGARTELNRHMSFLFRGPSWGLARPITQSAQMGAQPVLRAALDPDAQGGEYYAPSGRMEFKGLPERREPSPLSHDRDLQDRLWEVSEQLTGVAYNI
jgi:NAD(P)-dependent dehydrogenase (short-subunit alcohol dehydrogenase family)